MQKAQNRLMQFDIEPPSAPPPGKPYAETRPKNRGKMIEISLSIGIYRYILIY